MPSDRSASLVKHLIGGKWLSAFVAVVTAPVLGALVIERYNVLGLGRLAHSGIVAMGAYDVDEGLLVTSAIVVGAVAVHFMARSVLAFYK